MSNLRIWRTSSYSGPRENCVEVSLATWQDSSYSSPNGERVECASTGWHKSSYSGPESGGGGECVEVAEGPLTGVRDSKHPDHGALYFGATEWDAFLSAVRTNEL